MSPQRIQLRRTKGWRKPEGAVVVSRPSKWGNPWQVVPALPRMYRVGPFDVIHREHKSSLGRFAEDLSTIPGTGARYWAVRGYGLHLRDNPDLLAAARVELRGHDLACWCPLDQPCHADVLLELANAQARPVPLPGRSPDPAHRSGEQHRNNEGPLTDAEHAINQRDGVYLCQCDRTAGTYRELWTSTVICTRCERPRR